MSGILTSLGTEREPVSVSDGLVVSPCCHQTPGVVMLNSSGLVMALLRVQNSHTQSLLEAALVFTGGNQFWHQKVEEGML